MNFCFQIEAGGRAYSQVGLLRLLQSRFQVSFTCQPLIMFIFVVMALVNSEVHSHEDCQQVVNALTSLSDLCPQSTVSSFSFDPLHTHKGQL